MKGESELTWGLYAISTISKIFYEPSADVSCVARVEDNRRNKRYQVQCHTGKCVTRNLESTPCLNDYSCLSLNGN